MKAIVTGAAGFIGSTLVDRLLADGHTVTGIDSLSDYYSRDQKLANVARARENPSYDFHELDLVETDLTGWLKDVDVVFHQAGQPGVRKSWGMEFDHYVHSNITATQRVLEAIRAAGTSTRLVYASSSSVYGDAETYPTTERTLPAPVSPYGVTKLAAEHLCSLYAAVFGIRTVSLRYFTVFGARQRPDMAFSRFIRAALRGQPLTVFGTGDQVREFTHVDDIVEANLRAATRETHPGTVINLSGGAAVSVNDVIRELGDILQSELRVEHMARADGDVLRTGGSIHLASNLLGWAPKVSLREGLEREVAWLREREGSR